MVTYGTRDVPVQLVMSQLGQDADKALNNSVQSLEYNLASAIQKLVLPNKPQIALSRVRGLSHLKHWMHRMLVGVLQCGTDYDKS